MPAYYIGEHAITDAAVFDEYLALVMPMIERFGGRITSAMRHSRSPASAFFLRTAA